MLYAESDKGGALLMSMWIEGEITSPGVYAYMATGSVAAMSREEIDHNGKVLEESIKRAEGDYRKAKGLTTMSHKERAQKRKRKWRRSVNGRRMNGKRR